MIQRRGCWLPRRRPGAARDDEARARPGLGRSSLAARGVAGPAAEIDGAAAIVAAEEARNGILRDHRAPADGARPGARRHGGRPCVLQRVHQRAIRRTAAAPRARRRVAGPGAVGQGWRDMAFSGTALHQIAGSAVGRLDLRQGGRRAVTARQRTVAAAPRALKRGPIGSACAPFHAPVERKPSSRSGRSRFGSCSSPGDRIIGQR